jgi:hypothetical protein
MHNGIAIKEDMNVKNNQNNDIADEWLKTYSNELLN